jgi:hypothetical protein
MRIGFIERKLSQKIGCMTMTVTSLKPPRVFITAIGSFGKQYF